MKANASSSRISTLKIKDLNFSRKKKGIDIEALRESTLKTCMFQEQELHKIKNKFLEVSTKKFLQNNNHLNEPEILNVNLSDNNIISIYGNNHNEPSQPSKDTYKALEDSRETEVSPAYKNFHRIIDDVALSSDRKTQR